MPRPFVSEQSLPGVDDERSTKIGGPRGRGQQNLPQHRPGVGLFSFVVKGVLWGLITFFLARKFAGNDFWMVTLGVFLCSVPIALSGIYISTIRQIRRLTCFAGRGWLYRFFSRRLLRGILWSCWALGSSFFMLIAFHTYSTLEWLATFLVMPVFWAIFTLSRRFTARELKPYLVTATSVRVARLVSPLVMVTFYLVLLFLFAEAEPYGSLEQAIDAQKVRAADLTGSALVYEAFHYTAYYQGAKEYVAGQLGGLDVLWAAALLGLGSLVVFFNICAILSCFLIPAVEYRRVFGPLSEADSPPPTTPQRVAAITAVGVFVALFLYLPTFAFLENWVRQHPELAQARESAKFWAVPRLEQIGNDYFQTGTIEQLHQARLTALGKVELSLVQLEAQVDRAFDLTEANVDLYLDWYYSLPAEYMRIVKLLVGEMETYMAQKLAEHLLEGEPFKNLEIALQNAIEVHGAAIREYQETAQEIMVQNRVEISQDARFQIVHQMSLHEAWHLLTHSDLIALKARLGIATGVSAVMVTTITSKVAGKSIFKGAAKTMAKIAAGKAAGTAGGATAGGAIGFLIGGPLGATVGGVTGAAFGVAAGLTVDKMLLVLEEAVSREEFKQEIITAIGEAKAELKAGLGGMVSDKRD
jgi:hypothetical protein